MSQANDIIFACDIEMERSGFDALLSMKVA